MDYLRQFQFTRQWERDLPMHNMQTVYEFQLTHS